MFMKMGLRLSLLVLLISLTFNLEVKADLEYRNVNESSELYKQLTYLNERGILVGRFTTPLFAPTYPASRTDAITIIATALGLDDTKRDTIFSDVPRNYPDSGLIQSAVDKGIVTGYTDGTFKPYNNLTRGHFAVFIDRAFGKYLPSGSNTEFKDVPKNTELYNSVKKLSTAGITTGYSDKTFKPNETLTYGHLVTFMYRTVKYLEDKGIVYKTTTFGSIKGTVTWQYNQYVGTKPDVGAKVFVIPTNFDYKSISNDTLSLFALNIDRDGDNLFVGKANGYGQYEISDIPEGEYFVVISSKNTTRNIDEPVDSYLQDKLNKLLGSEIYSKFELYNLSYSKYTYETIKIQKDKTKDFSKDFGYTYF